MEEKEKIESGEIEALESESASAVVEEENLETLKDALEEKNKELAELQETLNQVQDKYLRLYAEFENFKKVVAKEQAELLNYGHERLITEILTVVDNLERAITHSKDFIDKINPEAAEVFEGLTSGVEMTLKQMMDILGRFGVKAIKALGESFDPTRHHAVSQVESDRNEPNTVVEELRKGYCLNDRVIRPSMVVVSKRSQKEVEISSGEDFGV
jgi:molecular chaperone GrpE